jgi:hypothetical protein
MDIARFFKKPRTEDTEAAPTMHPHDAAALTIQSAALTIQSLIRRRLARANLRKLREQNTALVAEQLAWAIRQHRMHDPWTQEHFDYLDELVRKFGRGQWQSKAALMKRQFPKDLFGGDTCRKYSDPDYGGTTGGLASRTVALEQLRARKDQQLRFDALLRQGSEGIEGIHFDKPPVHEGYSARCVVFYVGKYKLPLTQLFNPSFFDRVSTLAVRTPADFRNPLHGFEYTSSRSAEMHFGNLGTKKNQGTTIVTFMDCVRVLTTDENQLRFAMRYKRSLEQLFASKSRGDKIVGGIDDGAELVVNRTYWCDPITGKLGMRTVPPEITDVHYSRELAGRDLRATLLALKAAHGSATVVPISMLLELTGGETTLLRLGGSRPESGASAGSVVPWVLETLEAVQP